MTRHRLSNQTVPRNAPEPAGDRMPIPRSGLISGGMVRKTKPDCSLPPLEITLIGPVTTLPAWEHLPSRTIPKPFCP